MKLKVAGLLASFQSGGHVGDYGINSGVFEEDTAHDNSSLRCE